MVGSPIYMAPELLMGKKYDIKADVWSTGVCLFEMLFGCCPFEEKTIPLLINRLKTSTLQIPLNINNVSIRTQNLIRSFLVFNPDHRTTFEKGFQDLNEYFDGENFKDIGLSSLNPSPLNRQRSDFSGTGRMNYNKILQPKPAFSKETSVIPAHSFKKNIPAKAFKKQVSPVPTYTQINDNKINLSPTPSIGNYLSKTPNGSNVTRKVGQIFEKPKVRKVQVINRTLSSPAPYKIIQNEENKNYVKVDNEKKVEVKKPSTQQYLEYSNFEDIHQIKDKYNTREQTKKIKSPSNNTLNKNSSIEKKMQTKEYIKRQGNSNPPVKPKPDHMPPQIKNAISKSPMVNRQSEQIHQKASTSPKPIQRRLSEIERIDENIKRGRNSKQRVQLKNRRNSEKSPLKFDAGAALDRLRGKKKKASPKHIVKEYESNPRNHVEIVRQIKRETPLLVEKELHVLGGKPLSQPVTELISLLTNSPVDEETLVMKILRNRLKASLIIDVVRNVLEYFREEFREKQILKVQQFLILQIEIMERSEIDCTHFRANSSLNQLEKSFPLESLCYFGSLLLLKKAKKALGEVKEFLAPSHRSQLDDQLVNSQGEINKASLRSSKRKLDNLMILFCKSGFIWRHFSSMISHYLKGSFRIFKTKKNWL
jgi:hypothetical protein